MNSEKLSVNKACIIVFAVFMLISASMIFITYYLTRNLLAFYCGLIYVAALSDVAAFS